MFDEFQKSVKAVLYDRISSPLAGAFILSWFVWNWGLIYYVMIGDEGRSVVERIIYIKSNFFFFRYFFFYPLLSAAFFIFLYPYAANFVYRHVLKFNQKKKDIKIEVERQQCLTLEESIEIREEVMKLGEKYKSLNQEKDSEISRLKQEIEILRKQIVDFDSKNNKHEQNQEITDFYENEINKLKNTTSDQDEKKEVFKKIMKSRFSNGLTRMISDINKGYNLGDIDGEVLGYYLANDIIAPDGKQGLYQFTDNGKDFLKYYYDNHF